MLRRIFSGLTSSKPFKINQKYVSRPKQIFFWSFFIVAIVLVITGFSYVDPDWADFFDSFRNLGDRIKELLNWDFAEFSSVPQPDLQPRSFLYRSFLSIWETINMSFVGTVFGIALAIPVSICASKNLVTMPTINKFCKFILAIFRTIPSFVYALILVGFFGQRTLTITIAVSIFTFSISSKMMYDKFEQVVMKPYESMLATGASRVRSFRAAIVPQVMPHMLSTVFYMLETNIRYISIIGLVTKTGIGTLIESNASLQRWNYVGWLLFLLILTILLLEFLIIIFKKYVIYDKDFTLDQNQSAKLLDPVKKENKKNNLDFYLDNVVLKEINNQINELKFQLKNKNYINANEIKKKIWNLQNERKQIIEEEKTKYFNNIRKDKEAYKQIKTKFPNEKNKQFVFLHQYKINVRLDKVSKVSFDLDVNRMKNDMYQDVKKQVDRLHEEYVNSLTVEKVYQQQPKGWIKRLVLLLLLVGLFIYCLTDINWGLADKGTINRTLQEIKMMFQPEWWTFFNEVSSTGDEISVTVITLLIETFMIAVVGTFLGLIIAMILGLLGSENIVNKYVAKIFIVVATIFRPIPSYIYAIILVSLAGIGAFTGCLALAIGTAGMLSKYIRELFDDVDMKIVATLEASGLNKWQLFRFGILPQVSSGVLSLIVYRFEINFKETTLLGIVGAGRMGAALSAYFAEGLWGKFSALLLGIIIMTLILEYLSSTLRTKINYGLNPKYIHIIFKWISKRKTALYLANYAAVYKEMPKDVSFIELKGLYIHKNKVILNIAYDLIKDKSVSALSLKKGYYLAYCKTFELEYDGLDWNEIKKMVKDHQNEVKQLIKNINKNSIKEWKNNFRIKMLNKKQRLLKPYVFIKTQLSRKEK